MHKTYKIKRILTFILILFSLIGYSQSNTFKVTLDAGHGAHDFGAVYDGRIEKNIALAVVLEVGKITHEGTAEELLNSKTIQEAYLGKKH